MKGLGVKTLYSPSLMSHHRLTSHCRSFPTALTIVSGQSAIQAGLSVGVGNARWAGELKGIVDCVVFASVFFSSGERRIVPNGK